MINLQALRDFIKDGRYYLRLRYQLKISGLSKATRPVKLTHYILDTGLTLLIWTTLGAITAGPVGILLLGSLAAFMQFRLLSRIEEDIIVFRDQVKQIEAQRGI
jgi:hypothetical protein